MSRRTITSELPVLIVLLIVISVIISSVNNVAQARPITTPTEQVFPTRDPCLYDQECMYPTETPASYPSPHMPEVEQLPYPAPYGGVEENKPLPTPTLYTVDRPVSRISFKVVLDNFIEFFTRFKRCIHTPY